MLSVGVFTLTRFLLSGMDTTQVLMLVKGWVLIGLCVAFEIAMIRIARRAVARDRLVHPSAWIASVVVECLIPALFLFSMANSSDSPFDPYQTLTLPAVLLFSLFIVLSILRLSPSLAMFSGVVSAGSYGLVLGFVLVRYPIADHGTTALPVGMYITYSVILVLVGLSAALVSREIRAHVWAALREAEAERKMQLLHRDLDIAKSIQQGLLPKESPAIAGFDVAGWNRPADQTGGDYFDWQLLGDGRLAISLADVSGHGIGPALVTAVCRAYARASFPGDLKLGSMLDLINDLLVEDLPDDRFITFVIALLDHSAHHVDLLSAGHGPLLIYHAGTGEVDVLGAHGIPIGIVSQFGYGPEERVPLEPGDVVVLITDGFFEWANPDGEQFGTERLARSVAAHASDSGDRLIAGLLADVEEFARGTPQNDDLTAVVIKRNA